MESLAVVGWSQAAYDPNWYRCGVRITDTELATIALSSHNWHGEWNDTFAPSIPR